MPLPVVPLHRAILLVLMLVLPPVAVLVLLALLGPTVPAAASGAIGRGSDETGGFNAVVPAAATHTLTVSKAGDGQGDRQGSHSRHLG